MRDVECVWAVGAELGEGAIWASAEQVLWFVDIEGRAIHRFTPASGERRSWLTPDRVGFVVPTGDNRMIAGLAKRLAVFAPADGSFETLAEVEPDAADNRINDGMVGPDGALWFGTLHIPNTAPNGHWYRWDGAGAPRRFGTSYVVTNGPAFAPGGLVMYYCDSIGRAILCRSISGDGGIGAEAQFASIPAGAGYPDGLAVDADGCVWAAMFAGHAIRRYDPDGRLMESIALPCANITKPAFGGSDGRTLYVTTARAGLSRTEAATQPLAGALFAIACDTPGLMVPTFHLASTPKAD